MGFHEAGEIGKREEGAVEGEGEVAVIEGDGVVDGDELGAVGEGAFDLDFEEEFGDAGEDLVTAEEATSEVHEVGNGFVAVADEFEDLGGDESDGFRVIEADAAGEAFLGEETDVVEEEFVDVVGRKVHWNPPGERKTRKTEDEGAR
jgi:hypothetical protein